MYGGNGGYVDMYRQCADTGNTVVKAMAMLEEHNIIEKNVILLNLFSTPQGQSLHLPLLEFCQHFHCPV